MLLYSKFRIGFACLFLTALYVLVFCQGYGIFDDTKDISYRTALLRGDFTWVSISNIYIYFTGISIPLSHLLSTMPSVPWLGIELLLLHSFAVFICLYILIELFRGQNLLLFGVIAAFLFVALTYSESTFYLSIACSGMVGASSAVLGWLYVVNKIKSAWLRYVVAAACFIVFLIAVLNQNEVAGIAIACLFIFLILCYPEKKPVIKVYGFVALVYGLLYLFLHFGSDNYRDVFLKNESYLFSYYDASFHKNYLPQNPAEEIKMKAMDEWFVWDKQQFNAAFLEKITTNDFATLLGSFSLSTKLGLYLYKASADVAKRMVPEVLLSIFFILSALLSLREKKKVLTVFVLYKFLLLLFFSAISVILKYEFRILNPVLLFDSFLSFVFLLSNLRFAEIRKRSKVLFQVFLLLLLIVGVCWKHNYLRQCRTDQMQAVEYGAALRAEIDQTCTGKILAPDLAFVTGWVDNYPLVTTRATNNNVVMGYDAGYTPYYKEFSELLQQKCGGDDFRSCMNYLWKNKEQVIIIASETKINLWEKYLAAVYHAKVRFSKIQDLKTQNNNGQQQKTFAYYRISSLEQMQQ